jgi:Fe-S cluster biosynthesis and repair protein YggX
MGNDNKPGQRMVYCIKLQKELPGLDEPPFDGELGQRIYNQVSAEAWRAWGDFCKMVLNEYRLNPASPHDQKVIVQHMEHYFFGENPVAPPPEYVPPKS